VWPPLFKKRHVKEPILEPERLASLWRGEIEDEYAQAAIVGTTAIALRLMEKAASVDQALELAQQMWDDRVKDKICLG
jgi:anthranilate phosphoribosyltransferase